MKQAKVLGAVALAVGVVMSGSSLAKERTTGRGAPGAPVVYVESQGLYYDSIVLADLPMKGNFQQLIPGENGLSTAYGPGDVGHLGGRWWIDLNDNGEQDAEDKYFLCPLLGPGRTEL